MLDDSEIDLHFFLKLAQTLYQLKQSYDCDTIFCCRMVTVVVFFEIWLILAQHQPKNSQICMLRERELNLIGTFDRFRAGQYLHSRTDRFVFVLRSVIRLSLHMK